MAVTSWTDRWRDTAPVPVAVARGIGGDHALARLRAHPDLRVVSSPRHASVLVVVGAVPRGQLDALAAVHDQVPSPRAVAALGLGDDLHALGLGPVQELSDDDPGAELRELHRQVLAGHLDHPAVGPADNPVDWRGVGPHGQGGEGMMGGTPYGRMMPMPPTEGRDGLALDRLSLRLGPFLTGLPPGVSLDVGLQGDVLEEVTLHPADLDDAPVGTPVREPAGGPGEAGSSLVALAELCAVVGLDALARRAARVAVAPDPAAIRTLRRRLDRPWALRVATDGVGRLPDGTDATARWRAWLDRSAVLAEHGTPPPAAERPLDEITHVLTGQELGRAWVTLASLQPDLTPRVPAPTPAATP